jgi:hypothetical protein
MQRGVAKFTRCCPPIRPMAAEQTPVLLQLKKKITDEIQNDIGITNSPR